MATFAIGAVTRKAQATANGSTTQFAFSFSVNTEADVAVFVGTTLKTISTHYTVSITSSTGAGSITFTSGNTPTNGQIVTIMSKTALARSSVYTSGGTINATSLETDFDTNMMLFQQQDERLDRVITAPVDDASSIDMTLPNKDARKGAVLGFNATSGNPEAGPSITAVQSLADVTTAINLLGTSAVVEDMGLLATSAVIEDMGLLANSAAIEDMGLLATSAVIEDMGLLATSAVIEDMGLLATSAVISDMSTLAGSGSTPTVTSIGVSSNATFADNSKAIFGAGSDLQIYHDGTHSYIDDVSSGGWLFVRASELRLQDTGGTHTYLLANSGGAVSIRHDNAEKLTTTATGIDVTGAITADGLTVDGAVVFNEASADVDFRVESNGNANMLFVDGGANAVGIGNNVAASMFGVGSMTIGTGASGEEAVHTVYSNSNTYGALYFADATSGTARYQGGIDYLHSTDALRFYSSSVKRMTIDASGNLLVGKATLGINTNGFDVRPTGETGISVDGNIALDLNRTTNDGKIINLRKANTTVGSINVTGGALEIDGHPSASAHMQFGTTSLIYPSVDDAADLGASSHKFDDIYATNGTIQTSDRNEKQDVAALTATEMLVAARISGLFKTFRWKDKVAAKGANARTHTGIIAQDVQDAFTAESLDAGDYSLFISSTWWEHDVEVPAVEAVAEVTETTTDEDGNNVVTVTIEAVEAVDAYTRTDTYDTQSEAPAGATSKTRVGIRYPELLSFVAAYNEQRFASIETRLAALEAG